MTYRRIWIAALLLFAAAMHAQSIVTFAGGGSFDGQLATSVAFGPPAGVAIDPQGNVVLALQRGSIVRIDPVMWVVTTIAGNGTFGFSGDGGPALSAALDVPLGIAYDAAGNLFIADSSNGRVRRVDAVSGIITSVASGLDHPYGVAVRDGFLYVSEGVRVRRVDLATSQLETFAGSDSNANPGFSGDGGPATAAQLHTPCGLAFDAEGNLYIADDDTRRIRRVDTNGIITTYAGGGSNFHDGIPATQAEVGSLSAITVDAADNVVFYAAAQVKRVDRATGRISTVVDNESFLLGMACTSAGTLYLSDVENDQLSALVPGAHSLVRFAGGGTFVGDGHPATEALLLQPQGLTVDAVGDVYIADTLNNVVRRVTPDGTISIVAGIAGQPGSAKEGARATNTNIGYPSDVALDAGGNLYIADAYNNRVWRVDTAGKIRTYAGGGDPEDGYGDGEDANDGLITPVAIAFDGVGDLYIADDDLDAFEPRAAIRLVDRKHLLWTVAGGYGPGYYGDGGGAFEARLSQPRAITLAPDGTLYFSDYGNGAVRKISPSGQINNVIGPQPADAPLGDEGPADRARVLAAYLRFDGKTGDLYLADIGANSIRRIDTRGVIHTFVPNAGLADGDTPGIALAPNGNVLFASSENNRVEVVVKGDPPPHRRAAGH